MDCISREADKESGSWRFVYYSWNGFTGDYLKSVQELFRNLPPVCLIWVDKIFTENEGFGFQTIEIKDKVVYFSGEKIKFRGVNRHDSDPETGFVIDVRQIKKDLMLMKQHNFNAIRSSHYPNAPQFYQMCDEYGFMVIDEADIEAHAQDW